jgi:Asp/Glu/hydantoin racemase
MPHPARRIALISATPHASAAVERAFSRVYPEAELWNLLDDRLIQDAEALDEVTPELQARMGRLIDHALAERADGVLLTSSMYGFVARAHPARATTPIFGPDDASVAAVLSTGVRRVVVLASLPMALRDSTTRLLEAAARRSQTVDAVPVLAQDVLADETPGVIDARHVELLTDSLLDAMRGSRPGVDAILLAQYSLAPAADTLQHATGIPVFSGPERSALALRSILEPRRG